MQNADRDHRPDDDEQQAREFGVVHEVSIAGIRRWGRAGSACGRGNACGALVDFGGRCSGRAETRIQTAGAGRRSAFGLPLFLSVARSSNSTATSKDRRLR